MKLSILSVFSAVVAAVSALTPPVGDPKGNAIGRPGLNEQVEVGKPFTITWAPDTEGTVSLVLLRGPTENVVPIATIVEGIANSGSYVWTPSTALEADVARYGIQLIVDATGQYQYSTQFGIANDGAVVEPPVTTEEPTTTATTPAPTKEPTTTTKTVIDCDTEDDKEGCPAKTTAVPTTLSTTTTPVPSNTTTTNISTPTATGNTTTTVGSSKPTSPAPSPIQEESAAGKTAGSFGLVAFAAGVAALSFF